MPDATSGSAGVQESQQQTQQQQVTINDSTPFDHATMVPEGLRTEPYWGSFKGKTVGDVLRSGLEAHKTVGGSIRIPGEKATEEDWNGFYTRLRPETGEKYEVKIADDVKPYFDENKVKTMKDVFWKAGLHPRQVTTIMQAYQDMVGADQKTLQQQLELGRHDNINKIKSKLGAKFDETNVLVNRVAKRFGGEAFSKMVKDYNLDADPVFFETFASIAAAIHEDTWVNGNPPKFLSAHDANSRINEIRSDKTHPYHLINHPQHAAAVTEMDELYKAKMSADN